MTVAVKFQDWITIRATSNVPIIQDEAGWGDYEAFTDLVAYVETGESLATPLIELQTSPSRDPSLFRTMSTASVAASSMNKYTWLVRFATAGEPLARFVRWSYTGAASPTISSLTFRIYLSLNSQGGFVAPFPRMTGAGSMRDR